MNRRILGSAVLFMHCIRDLLQFEWSHLHMKNMPESETGNERIEKKDGSWKRARGKKEAGGAALKVVGRLRSRCTK